MNILSNAQNFEYQLRELINNSNLNGVTVFYILQKISLELNIELLRLQVNQVTQQNLENISQEIENEEQESGQD